MENKHNLLRHISETSIFVSLINKIIFILKKQIRGSFFVGLLCSYTLSDDWCGSSIIARTVSAVVSFVKKICRAVSTSVEESRVCSSLDSFKDKLFCTTLQSYGVSFGLFGLTSFVITVAKMHFNLQQLILSETIWISFILVIIGLSLCFSKQAFGTAVHNSVILSFVMFRLIGFRKGQIPTAAGDGAAEHFTVSLFGFLLGAATFFIPIKLIVMMCVGIVVASAIFCAPELGVILCFLVLPFCTTMQITALSLIVALAFMIKLIRGKRYITVYKMDVCIILFSCVLLFLGALTSVTPAVSLRSVIMFLIFIMMYFITSNALNTYKWVSKAASALTVAGLLSAVVGIYQNFSGLASSLVWVDTEMFENINARVIGTFDNPNVFGEFLILLLPLSIALFATRKGIVKYLALISSAAMGWALILTYSRGAWLGFAAAILVFLVLFDDIWIKIGIVCIAASPLLIQFIPSSIMSRITSIGNLADTSTSYRVSIWIGASRMLGDFWIPGIGVGSAAFLSVYPAYALSGAGYAQHAHNLYLQIMSETGIAGLIIFIFVVLYFFKMTLNTYHNISMWEIKTLAIAVAAGVGAFLIQGMTDYVWYNYRITLLFWMILGLATALYRSGCKEWGSDRENVGDYKLKGGKAR